MTLKNKQTSYVVPPAKGPRGGKSARPGAAAVAVRPATWRDWIGGARPRTLPLAMMPVLMGVGAAQLVEGEETWHPIRAIACLALAFCLQIGTNYANDYSDGIRGVDDVRVGPTRLTGSGRAKPERVLRMAMIFFGIVALIGFVLVIITQLWWLLPVGVLNFAGAWFYTGGKKPYGYYALGEVSVFLFFGLIATTGTTYVLSSQINQASIFAGVVSGLIAAAVLLVNNIRDREQDRQNGKKTSAVLMGNLASRIVYCFMIALAFAGLWLVALLYPLAAFGFFALLIAVPSTLIVLTAKTGKELNLALSLTALTGLAVAIAFAVGYAF